jgi:hypothetical protein
MKTNTYLCYSGYTSNMNMNTMKAYKLMQHIDALLSDDSVNNGRC